MDEDFETPDFSEFLNACAKLSETGIPRFLTVARQSCSFITITAI
ncbi:MAG: hypothetical protein PUG68_01860 [Lachnospiraceae bacterium]|nr:hypothetical protein [Lachnospiraceae bacterium]MDY2760293.1 hypothetical protein [Lachnospiraceae bacterium]